MGAIKSNDNYSEQEWQLAKIARALAHPARIQMVRALRQNGQYRNIDFAAILNMAPSSVNDHVEKLKDAELVGIEYQSHFYLISLNHKRLNPLSHFILENN